MNRRKLFIALAIFSLLLGGLKLRAQEDKGIPKPTDQLSATQGQLAEKYQRLEMLMLKMAEVDGVENPRRSALLKKALVQSKDKHIRLQMETLVKVISQENLRRAVDDQTQVRDDLKLILQLLEAENRTDRLKSEQSRIRQYIRELQRVIRQQKSVQGRTEGGENTSRLSRDQEKVAGRTEKLAKLMDDNESAGKSESVENDTEKKEEGGKPEGLESDGQQSDGQQSDGEKPDGKQSESQKSDDQQKSEGKQSDDEKSERQKSENEQSDGEKSDGQQSEGQESEGQESEGQESEGQPSDGQKSDGQQPGQKSEGQPSQNQSGQPNQGPPSDQQQQQPNDQQQQESFPGRKRIAAAEERMRQAQKQLDEAKRDEAVNEQEEARTLLEQAKAELEEILRQLREEEVERTLAQLESRFKKMLEMQIKVLDDTTRLGKVDVDKRNKAFDIQAGKLSLSERMIVEEADRAVLLLMEEGSSVAFPESTQQIRDDMEIVAELLSQSDVGDVTQEIEQDIITALEEMVEALQKAQKENEQKKQQQQQQQQNGEQQDRPLVDAIAELKMIRALQMRINKRTKTYSRLLEDVEDPAGQVSDIKLIESLQNLSDREEKVRRITRDIVLGKNQ